MASMVGVFRTDDYEDWKRMFDSDPVGRKQVVGRPFMYGTTREFLERFGLNDISDLPKVDELSDALGFELPGALSEPTITTSPLPFEATEEQAAAEEPERAEGMAEDGETVH